MGPDMPETLPETLPGYVSHPVCFSSVGFKGSIEMSTFSKSPTLWQQLLEKDLSHDNKPIST